MTQGLSAFTTYNRDNRDMSDTDNGPVPVSPLRASVPCAADLIPGYGEFLDGEIFGPAHDALNRMRRAEKNGTGCYLTAEMIKSLAVTCIGQIWAEDDPRSNLKSELPHDHQPKQR